MINVCIVKRRVLHHLLKKVQYYRIFKRGRELLRTAVFYITGHGVARMKIPIYVFTRFFVPPSYLRIRVILWSTDIDTCGFQILQCIWPSEKTSGNLELLRQIFHGFVLQTKRRFEPLRSSITFVLNKQFD